MATVGIMMWLMFLFSCVLVGTYSECRRRCNKKYPELTCPERYSCLEEPTTGKHKCYDVCKDHTGLVPNVRHCAGYFDCANSTVQNTLKVPHQRECSYRNHQLFDVDTLTCRDHADVNCTGRFRPKRWCDYQDFSTDTRIKEICLEVYYRTDCTRCSYFSGCVGKTDGRHFVSFQQSQIVECSNQLDFAYYSCKFGAYIPSVDSEFCVRGFL